MSYSEDLHALADFLADRPELEARAAAGCSIAVYVWCYNAEELARFGRMLGAATKEANGYSIGLSRKFGAHELRVLAQQSQICERVEVGQEEYTVTVSRDEMRPDDVELTTSTTVTVVRTRPVYETKCPDTLLGVT